MTLTLLPGGANGTPKRKHPLALRCREGWIPCLFCGQPLVEEMDGTHCGGCSITWWERAA